MNIANEPNNEKVYTLTDEDMALISGGNDTLRTVSQERVPGIPCPQCGKFIPLSIQTLMTSPDVVCPHCHTKLVIPNTVF